MMPNTNIKAVYDFLNQQPENSNDKLNSLVTKNANTVKGSDPIKAKRSNVSTVNTKRTVPSSINPIKIEGEILIEESERDNRFARPTTTKKSSNTPNRQNSLSQGKNSGGTSTSTAGKSVNKPSTVSTKSKSPVRAVTSTTANVKKPADNSKDVKSSKSPVRQSTNTDNLETVKEKLNESVSSQTEDLKTSKSGLIKHSNSLKNLSNNRSETPNSKSGKNATPANKLNRSFTGVPENSNTRPKTPKPNPPKNCKISAINKISSNNMNILSTRNGDNNESTGEPIKEFKQSKTVNTSIYNAPAKNTTKNVPAKMNPSKKNVIEGILADGDEVESTASTTPNKSKLEQFKEQNMFNNKNSNIFQVAKEEKDAKQTKYGNLNTKKLNTETGETNNSYNLINKKKVDLKFISTSPIIRKKDYDNLKKNSLKPEDTKNANNQKNVVKKVQEEKPPVTQNEENKTAENTDNPNRRIIKSVHEFSRVGYSGSSKKVNQDNYFVYRNLGGNPNHIFLGVCDGHGEIGHEVSGYLRENLPFLLNRRLKILNKNILTDNINSIIVDTFLDINSKLHKSQVIDTSFSGSTCSSMILTPEKVLTANVGDSRTILGRLVDGVWQSFNITRDHKPTEKDESERIKSQGGRILPFRDEDTNEFVGPARVWIQDEDIPGLAMTRSFGDQVASTVGVIAEPEIFEHKFTEEDKFLIVASDGIWEFIESEECVEIIKDFYLNNDIVACCEYLYRESCKRWMKEEEVIDDITMIIMFFE